MKRTALECPPHCGFRNRIRGSSGLVLWVCAWLLCIACHAPKALARTADATVVGDGGAVTSTSFAIADLDGDRTPDFASIRDGRGDSASSDDYWINFRLSSSGWRSMRFVGPRGGLGIEARDVNGDRAIDLVLTTAWFRQPVAILMNDGHGGFSSVSPAAFPGAFRGTNRVWNPFAERVDDSSALPQQNAPSFYAGLGTASALSSPSRTESFQFAFFASWYTPAYAGRGPPTQTPSL